MRILMIAPEPFFEPRGTPFSEYHRIRALLELGHTVDLVTYPFGRDVALSGLRVFRCLRPPLMTGIVSMHMQTRITQHMHTAERR